MDDPPRRGALARPFALHPHGKRWRPPSRSIRAAGRAAGAATAFLTRAPGLARFRYEGSDLVRGAVMFPLVGAAVGALVGGVVIAGGWLGMSQLMAASLGVAVAVVVTGALHLDGLADSADGLAGGSPERTLQIMREHSVGVYGISAVVLSLLLQVSAIASLPLPRVLPTLVAVHAVARAAPLVLAAAHRYAGGDGTGREFVTGMRWPRAAAGLVIASAVAIAAAGTVAIGVVGCLAVATVGSGMAARRRLGGVTGDLLGAAVELTLVASLVLAAAVQ